MGGSGWSRRRLTFVAEGPVVGRAGAVAGVAVVLLHAPAAVLAVRPVAGAVARAAGLEPGGDLRSFFQVQGHPIHPQGADAAQEALLASGATCGQQRARSSDRVTSAWLCFRRPPNVWEATRWPSAASILAFPQGLPNGETWSFPPLG